MKSFKLISLATVLIAGGCCCHPPVTPPPPVKFSGVPDTMDLVIADINRNSQAIPSIWSQTSFTALLNDPVKKTSQSFSGTGVVLFQRPNFLLLNGSETIAGPVFSIGSNDQEFWLKIRTAADDWNYYWGHYANLGKPECDPIPIEPNLIVEVLGVALFKTDFLQQPVPVMRFSREADEYIFDFNARLADRWATVKEIHYDRATKQPRRVILYNADAREVLRADLSNVGKVEVPDAPQSQWPTLPRQYAIVFDETNSTMTLALDEPALTTKVRNRIIPNPNSFNRPDYDSNNKVIQVDARCK